jgi:hypothetical protein
MGAYNAHLVPPSGGVPASLNFFSDRKQPGVFVHLWPGEDPQRDVIRRILTSLKLAFGAWPHALWWIPPSDSSRVVITAGFTAAGQCGWNPDVPDARAEWFMVRAQRVLYEALRGGPVAGLADLAPHAAQPTGRRRDYHPDVFARRLAQRFEIGFAAL